METNMKEIKELHDQSLYLPNSQEIVVEQTKMLDLLFEYNSLAPSKKVEKERLLKEMFYSIGKNCYIETPFHSNFGGGNVIFGDNVYANFNLTLVDDTYIEVGNNVMFGPNVTLATAGHPIEPSLRKKGYQYNAPITIGDNVWIGANTLVMPGVKIGENSVIGGGSVVTKDVPANVVAFGNPCKVYRLIGEKDRKYYFKDKMIDETLFKE